MADIDWQGRAGELLAVILPMKSFKAGEFEKLTDSAWAKLIASARKAVAVDARLENEELKRELAAASKQSAAIQRLKKLGATAEDLAAITGA